MANSNAGIRQIVLNGIFYMQVMLLLCCCFPAVAQQDRMYRLNWKIDAPALATGIGLSHLGKELIKSKPRLTPEDLLGKNKEDVFWIDRFAVANESSGSKLATDIALGTSLALPLGLLLDNCVRSETGTIAVMYLEALALTNTVFTFTTAVTHRRRPFVYNEHLPMERRLGPNATDSFMSGHTAMAATASFFCAKVLHDFHPNHDNEALVWFIAAIVPAGVSYYRIKAGKHYLTDTLLGYAVGAGSGILVPQLHKTGKESAGQSVKVLLTAPGQVALVYVL